MQILSGHVSPETAYVVDDYPYGFRLRCSIRYWLEYQPRHGFRLVSQTTNPKRGNVWNKPKASTYCRFGGCMYLDGNGHVQWTGLGEYSNGAEAKAWSDTYRDGVPEVGREMLNRWVAAKLAYDAKRNGDHTLPLAVGLPEARKAFVSPHVTRFVCTYIGKDGLRTLIGPAQGRHTYATKEEAEAHLAAVLGNNSPDTLQQTWGDNPRFEVRPCQCWAEHFDPVSAYFD